MRYLCGASRTEASSTITSTSTFPARWNANVDAGHDPDFIRTMMKQARYRFSQISLGVPFAIGVR